MFKHEELAYMSGGLALIAFSFLVQRVYITKNTDNLTFIWIFLVILAQAIMYVYGKLNHVQGLYIPATIYVIGLAYILYVKVVYKETNKIEEELKDKNIIK
jgi:uncharacterized membrane protein YhhN